MEQQYIEKQIKPNKMAFQVAAAFSIYTLLLIFLFKLLGIDVQQENVPLVTTVMSAILSYLPFVLAIFYAQIRHRTELGGYITFGRAFSTGFRVGATAGMFIGLLMILYYKVLDPSAMNHILDNAIIKAGDNDKAINNVKTMGAYMPVMIGFGAAVSYTIYGIVISLAGAVLNKRIAPVNFD